MLLIVSVFAACNNETTEPTSELPGELAGEWSLVSVTCFCPSVNLNPGENVWVFDTANDELIVESSLPAETYLVPNSGTYDAVIDEAANTIDIEFSFFIHDYFFIGDDTLIIDALYVIDEVQYELVR